MNQPLWKGDTPERVQPKKERLSIRTERAKVPLTTEGTLKLTTQWDEERLVILNEVALLGSMVYSLEETNGRDIEESAEE